MNDAPESHGLTFDPSEKDAYNVATKPATWAELRWVTPELAREWVTATNIGNRNISRNVSRRWQDVFDHGRYRLTHQGIAFDEAGRLVDGQHRLTGLANSIVPGVWMLVAHETARAGFAVMDTGLARSAGHLIPPPNASAKAAAARLLLNYPRVTTASGWKPSNEQILSVYSDLREWIDEATALAGGVYKTTRISHTVHTAVLTVLLASDYPREAVYSWCEGLASGVGLMEGDPRLALRNRFAVEWQHLNNTGGVRSTDGAHLIIRAWNAYAKGESRSILKVPRTAAEAPPEIVR